MEFRGLGEVFTEYLKFLAPKTMRQKLREVKAEAVEQKPTEGGQYPLHVGKGECQRQEL